MQKLINFTARVISGRRKFDRVSDVRESLGWLSSNHMFIHHTLTILHKIRTSGEPVSLAGKFYTNQDNPTRVRKTRRDQLT